jgi:hypothetical protein
MKESTNESTSRRRAPLIPTISTLDEDQPVEHVERASDEGPANSVVIANLESGSGLGSQLPDPNDRSQ